MGTQAHNNVTPIQNELSMLLISAQAKISGLQSILANTAEGELNGLTSFQLSSILDPIDKDLRAALQQMGCKSE